MKRNGKKLLSLLLALALIFVCLPQMGLPVRAAETSGKCGDSLRWQVDLSTGELTITGDGKMWSYDSRFQAPWNYYWDCIKTVSLSKGITHIGDRAFYGLSVLESVTIPDGVTSIGVRAFAGCTKMESVKIPPSLKSFADHAFYRCDNLKRVDITDLASWCGIVFEEEEKGTNFCNPLFYAGNLYLNRKLLTDLIIPKGVTSIGTNAFTRCTCLKRVIIPDGVKIIGSEVFQFCSELQSVTIPNSLTRIPDSAFYQCTSLSDISIPVSVTEIGEFAFAYCGALKKMTIPDGVSKIERCMFYECTNLNSVTIPNSVTSIREEAFSSCKRLADVYYGGDKTDWGCIYIENGNEPLGAARRHYNVNLKTDTVNQAIDAANAVNRSIYTKESLEAMDVAVEIAKAAMESGNQDAINRSLAALNAAIKALVKRMDTDDSFRFDDTQNSNAFYYDAVYWAYGAKPQITNGLDKTHFGPDKSCTRGQVVTFLWRTAGCPKPGKTETAFTDLPEKAFYAKAVAWAVEKGITKGMTATTFAPDATCTRGQIVTFLWRFKGEQKASSTATPFKDVSSKAFYAKAVAWAVENNVTNGMTKDTFAPEATCTRGQIVTFLYRAANGS